MKHFDAIIIGSGQGGTPLAKKLAKAGYKTALVERRFIGGTCVNDGCTPTKTMVASARLAHLARNSAHLGVHIKNVSVDLKAIVARKNKIVDQFRNGALGGLQKTENLELIFGEASFIGNKQLSVNLNDGGNEQLQADHVFINTGTATSIPDIEGLDTIPYLTSTTILDVTEIPRHLLIVGGGYIGLEFGQMFRRFGSEVTLLETNNAFLPHEDRDIADCLRGILEAEGLNIHIEALAKNFEKSGNDIIANIEADGKPIEINCSHILIAAGRRPQTKELHLEQAGVATNEKGFIQVNDRLETNIEGIYALGDVKGGPAFTHISYNDHLVIYKNLVEKDNRSTHERMVPYCMFTDPQLGRVGITEDEAKEKSINYKVATISMEHVARAIETGETKGMMKAVVDADSQQILGVAIIGEEGGEIMSVLQMAMAGKITYPQIREFVFAHPLYAESLNNLFMSIMK